MVKEVGEPTGMIIQFGRQGGVGSSRGGTGSSGDGTGGGGGVAVFVFGIDDVIDFGGRNSHYIGGALNTRRG